MILGHIVCWETNPRHMRPYHPPPPKKKRTEIENKSTWLYNSSQSVFIRSCYFIYQV